MAEDNESRWYTIARKTAAVILAATVAIAATYMIYCANKMPIAAQTTKPTITLTADPNVISEGRTLKIKISGTLPDELADHDTETTLNLVIQAGTATEEADYKAALPENFQLLWVSKQSASEDRDNSYFSLQALADDIFESGETLLVTSIVTPLDGFRVSPAMITIRNTATTAVLPRETPATSSTTTTTTSSTPPIPTPGTQPPTETQPTSPDETNSPTPTSSSTTTTSTTSTTTTTSSTTSTTTTSTTLLETPPTTTETTPEDSVLPVSPPTTTTTTTTTLLPPDPDTEPEDGAEPAGRRDPPEEDEEQPEEEDAADTETLTPDETEDREEREQPESETPSVTIPPDTRDETTNSDTSETERPDETDDETKTDGKNQPPEEETSPYRPDRPPPEKQTG